MKTISFTLLLSLIVSSCLLAQTEKGRWILGAQVGTFNYQHQNGTTVFTGSLTPSAGYFVADGLAIGTGVPLSFSTQKNDYSLDYSSTSIGISPYLRYFIGKSALKPYLGVAYSYSKTHSNSTSSTLEATTEGYATSFVPTLGLAYFFTRNLALNAGLSYVISHQEQKYLDYKTPLAATPPSSAYINDSKSMSLSIGLQIFIGR